MQGFRSEAHRRKIQELVTQGKIKQSDYDKHARETHQTVLPERLPKPVKGPKR